ncbi:MAG: hypothetical protein JSV76_00720 [Candidatus Bathyarchaeota archaeon]|nr:MAG: hypothetical protein JSV76_00720 [Candidatus Bathyarchaeota archaeon]
MLWKATVSICSVLVLVWAVCVVVPIPMFGVWASLETGNWVKYDVTIEPLLEGEVVPTWILYEFISVEGTNATVRVTIHLSDGDEWDGLTSIDVVSGSHTGLIIPSNSEIGDSVHISDYGTLSIEGIGTSTYTGVTRTVMLATFSNSTTSLTYYWDEQTGVMLEQNISKDEITTYWKIRDTNIWQTRITVHSSYQNFLYFGIILAIVLPSIFFLRRRKKVRQ